MRYNIISSKSNHSLLLLIVSLLFTSSDSYPSVAVGHRCCINIIQAFPVATSVVATNTIASTKTFSSLSLALSLSSSSNERHLHRRQQQHLLQRKSWLYQQRGGATANTLYSSSATTSTSSSENSPIVQINNRSSQQILDLQKFVNKNFFVLGMIGTVTLSYLFPSLGATGGILHPELWLNQYGVSYVFLLSGLSIQLAQMKEATYNMKLNVLIQLILFVVWPFGIGVPIKYFGSTLLLAKNLISKPLLDGIMVLTCLPTTVNMCVILTSTVGANVASSLCNAVLSNMLGIVVTPLLLFRFFGSDITLPFYDMVIKLMNKVLLPVVIGQLLRARVPSIKNWYYRHEKMLKRSQEIILLGILWNAFCTAITSQLGVSMKDGIALLSLLPVVHLFALAGTFAFFSLPSLKLSRGEIIAAMFCSSQKTLAFGLPLIQTIFEGNTNLAIYSAPLMIIHPIQLMIGSILVPKLERYIKSERNDGNEQNRPGTTTF